jgi:hypothetical protein
MAQWPYQRAEFRFAASARDGLLGGVIGLLIFYGTVIWLMFKNPLPGILILPLPTIVLVMGVVSGALQGAVDSVVCTADGLGVTRRFLFSRERRTDTYRWETFTVVDVELRKFARGRKFSFLVVDVARRPKALEVRTDLIDCVELLDIIAAMTPHLPYRWVRRVPDTSGQPESYSLVDRARSAGDMAARRGANRQAG